MHGLHNVQYSKPHAILLHWIWGHHAMRYMKNECIREALGEFRGIREKKNNNACIAAPHWCLKLEVCKTIKQKKTVRVYLFVRDRTRTLSVPAFPNTPWLTAKV